MTKIEVRQTINAPAEEVWQTIRTFENPERFVPIVTNSDVQKTGNSTVRTCSVQMGNQEAKLVEKLDKIDDEHKVLEFSVSEAPPPFAGLQNRYKITRLSDGKSEINISTELNAPSEVTQMIEGIFQMTAEGLKKLHEKEVI